MHAFIVKFIVFFLSRVESKCKIGIKIQMRYKYTQIYLSLWILLFLWKCLKRASKTNLKTYTNISTLLPLTLPFPQHQIKVISTQHWAKTRGSQMQLISSTSENANFCENSKEKNRPPQKKKDSIQSFRLSHLELVQTCPHHLGNVCLHIF